MRMEAWIGERFSLTSGALSIVAMSGIDRNEGCTTACLASTKHHFCRSQASQLSILLDGSTRYTDPVMVHRSSVLLTFTLAFMSGSAVVAHHGSSISYQLDKTISVAGTVTEWAFVNPHPQIYFDVKDAQGAVAHWATELLPSPSMMKNMKAGWTRTSIKPGDQMKLVCNPSRVAGAKACLARELEINGKAWPVGAGPGAAGAKGKQ